MKKIYSLLFLLVVSYSSFGQTIYSENMGVPTANTLIPAYVTGTAPATFQNSAPIVYTGTADVRTSLASSGYVGTSGGGNVLINAVDEFFQIDGINTSAYTTANLQLAFGVNTPSAVTNVLIVEVSTNGTTWTPLTYTPSGTNWTLATINSGIPSSATLSIRFKSNSTTQYRIDDVKVSNVNASCTLTLGVPTVVCDASTLNLDTYTATIAYTGGTTGAYTITPSSGTIGGDNPATLAAGNITVTGITEGTNFTLTVTKGVCSYTTNANSPECKPVNALPYSEPFNYTAGSILGNSQRWSNVNAGDDIVAVTGNLTYTGVTSTGNSVSLSGAGKECTTAFTPTTSGTLYTAFLLNVTNLALTTEGNSSYFAGICGTSNSDYKGRIFVKRTGTQYSLGFDIPSTTANYETTLRDVATTVYVVIGYDFTANSLTLWINPTNGSAPALSVVPTTAFTSLGWFTLRQDADNNTPAITVDELRVTTTLADLGLTLGVSKNNDIAGLKMYPNPVSNGTLFIETAANTEKTVAVYDVLGKLVLNTTTSDNAVNVSALHTGIYIVNITEEGKTASRKLVIR